MSSGFISETELAEQRRVRQEEWEKVRSADQPLEAPEPAYDSRCLYDRLQEQKNKRDAEYEEAHKLKNMIKGLDDDEVEFLDLIDRTKMAEERKKNLEEEKEMRDFKAAVASLQEKSLDKMLTQDLKQPQTSSKPATSSKNSQLKLIAGVIKKPVKNEDASRGVKRKLSETESSSSEKKSEVTPEKQANESNEVASIQNTAENTNLQKGALKCIAILPGLCSYESSSDSDSDSDQDHGCKYKKDLLGRPIIPPKEKAVE